MLGKLLATKKIYDIINHAVETRRQSGVQGDDTLQILLDSGDDKMVILGVRVHIYLLTWKDRQSDHFLLRL